MTLFTHNNLLVILIIVFSTAIGSAQKVHESMLTFGYTAKPMKKGQGYLNTYNGLIYQAEMGVTNNFSIGVGTSIFTFFKGYYPRAFGLKAKLAFPVSEKIHLGLGTFVMPRFEDHSLVNRFNHITFGLMTVDINTTQITFGAGVNSYNGLADPVIGNHPIFNFGFIVPVSKKGFLIAENWINFYSNNYGSKGYLFLSGWSYRFNLKRFILDLGLVGAFIDDGDGFVFLALPQVSFSYCF